MDDQNQVPGQQAPTGAGDQGGQPTSTPPADPGASVPPAGQPVQTPDQTGQTPPPAPTEQPAGGSVV